jgi:hypothetical protein
MDRHLVPVFMASVEGFLKSASTRKASHRGYTDQLEALELVAHRRDFEGVYAGIAQYLVNEAFKKTSEWDVEDGGQEVTADDVYETVVNRTLDPQNDMDVEVPVEVTYAEWISYSRDMDLPYRDLEKAMVAVARGSKKEIKDFLGNKWVREYIHSSIMMSMARIMHRMRLPEAHLKAAHQDMINEDFSVQMVTDDGFSVEHEDLPNKGDEEPYSEAIEARGGEMRLDDKRSKVGKTGLVFALYYRVTFEYD